MKVKVTIKHTQTAIVDIGGFRPELVQQLLVEGDGYFGETSFGLTDVGDAEDWVVDGIAVEEVKPSKRVGNHGGPR